MKVGAYIFQLTDALLTVLERANISSSPFRPKN